MHCPGQDRQFWDKDAIFEVECARCGRSIEFFKDEASRRCGNCGLRMLNPRMDLGCASYCKFGAECIGGESHGIQKKDC